VSYISIFMFCICFTGCLAMFYFLNFWLYMCLNSVTGRYFAYFFRNWDFLKGIPCSSVNQQTEN
jgi:hypothetical protein